jgi:hypothetical protein
VCLVFCVSISVASLMGSAIRALLSPCLLSTLTASSALSALADVDDSSALQDVSNGNKPRKRKHNKKDQIAIEYSYNDPGPDTSISLEAIKTPAKKKRKKGATSPNVSQASSTKKPKKGKQLQSPTKARKNAVIREETPPAVQPTCQRQVLGMLRERHQA